MSQFSLLFGIQSDAYTVACFFYLLLTIRAALRANNSKAKSSRPLSVAIIAWILFGINEYVAHVYGTNIRVDLLFLSPIILVISVYATGSFIKSLFIPE